MKKLYIENFGIQPPPAGTEVAIRYSAGLDYYILWLDCPHGENIIDGWISLEEAKATVNGRGWVIRRAPRTAIKQSPKK